MKRCPYCTQAIQDDAMVCPHCHTNFATVSVPPPPQGVAPPTGTFQQGQTPIPGDSYASAAARNSGLALWSMILGIGAYVIVPFVGAIAAVVLGHLGLSEIKKSAGRLKGDGMAIAGLVLGYLQFAGLPLFLIIAAIAIPNLLKAKMAANEAVAVGSLRTLTTAEISYASACPKIGFSYSLSEMGPSGTECPEGGNQLDSVLAGGMKKGYLFTPHISSFTGSKPETGFGWNADPVSQSSGTRHFFVDQTGVIRYSSSAQADETSTPLR